MTRSFSPARGEVVGGPRAPRPDRSAAEGGRGDPVAWAFGGGPGCPSRAAPVRQQRAGWADAFPVSWGDETREKRWEQAVPTDEPKPQGTREPRPKEYPAHRWRGLNHSRLLGDWSRSRCLPAGPRAERGAAPATVTA